MNVDMEKEAVEETAYSEGTPPYQEYPASRQERRHGPRGVTLAIIMIGAGVAILLSNMGIISFSWGDLWHYWPVLLILVGLDIILGGRSAFGSLLLAVMAIVVIGGLIFWADALPSSNSMSDARAFGGDGETITADFAEPLGAVDSVNATLDLGVGEIYLEALEDSSNVVEGEYSGPSWFNYVVDYRENNGEGKLTVKQEGDDSFRIGDSGDPSLNLYLTGQVPMDLTISPGVSESNLDLSGLDLTALEINSGVGEVHITLPESSEIEKVDVAVGVGETYLYPPSDSEDLYIDEINVSGGVGSFEVELPEQGDYTLDINVGVGSMYIDIPGDLEARIELREEGLTDIEIGDRFEQISDGVWESEDYDGAANRVLITIVGGVGSVEIND